MALDINEKVKIQQRIIERLTAENENLSEKLASANIKINELLEREKEYINNSKYTETNFKLLIKEFNEQKELYHQQIDKFHNLIDSFREKIYSISDVDDLKQE